MSADRNTEYSLTHLRRAREILFGDAGAEDADEDSGPWLVRPVDLAKHIAAGELAWRLMYRHEARWANLPLSEREAALQKALESEVAAGIAKEDRIERLETALREIIGLDHHNHGPESRATKIARDAVTESASVRDVSGGTK